MKFNKLDNNSSKLLNPKNKLMDKKLTRIFGNDFKGHKSSFPGPKSGFMGNS